MRVLAGVARWSVLLASVALALLYLNSAAYSAWAAGGPPTTIRDAWVHRAFGHLCYAVATVFAGLAVFRVCRPRRRYRGALLLAAAALVFIAAPHVRRFVLVDRCLDAGGRWDAAAFMCER